MIVKTMGPEKYFVTNRWAYTTKIIVEAKDGMEDQVKAIVKESMEEAFKKTIPEVPFVTGIRMADACG